MKKLLSGKKEKTVWLLLPILWILLIWGHSVLPGSVSTGESNALLALLDRLLTLLGSSWQLTPFLVRKAAHFTEFFILGILLSRSLRTLLSAWPLPFDSCAVSAGLLIALCDETIQNFRPGRAALLSDVMIDLSGVVAGVLLSFLFRKALAVIRAGRGTGRA